LTYSSRTVKEIVDEAFANCTQLMSVELGEGLESIERAVLYGCESLESIIIPSTVKEIDRNAFKNCTSLIAVEFCDEIEQFVDEVALPWWNNGVSKAAWITYSFLANRNILARLGTIQVQKWKDNMHDMLRRIPVELSDIEDDDSENESENQFIKKEHGEYFDWMEYRVSNY
jgi:hypothetical protein